MNLLKKIRNIWKLGELTVTKNGNKLNIDYIPDNLVEEKPKLAQIIHMKDEEKIINELLNDK